MRVPAALAALAVALAGCGGSAEVPAGVGGAPDTAPSPSRDAAPQRELPYAEVGARVLRRTPLRAAPSAGAKVVGQARRRTEFGNPAVLRVESRRRGWARVLHASLDNGERAWVDERDIELVREPWAIEVDLSARRARVLLHGEVIDRFPVGIGRAGTDTPTGTFAVTDMITTRDPATYGCCILALTGHQPNLPPGWIGGDRLALHGTPDESTVGSATSTGCIRVRERDLRRLLRRIRLGARVTIRT